MNANGGLVSTQLILEWVIINQPANFELTDNTAKHSEVIAKQAIFKMAAWWPY
jgi:hypothetical protein